jgi:hypothetical protein
MIELVDGFSKSLYAYVLLIFWPNSEILNLL